MSQVELFKAVYERENGRCQVTGENIVNPSFTCFPHIVPKSRSPKHRLNPNNVMLVKQELHTVIDDIAIDNLGLYEELLDNDVRITYEILVQIAESEESREDILSLYIPCE